MLKSETRRSITRCTQHQSQPTNPWLDLLPSPVGDPALYLPIFPVFIAKDISSIPNITAIPG
jgi:hypothetical protein